VVAQAHQAILLLLLFPVAVTLMRWQSSLQLHFFNKTVFSKAH
jgi:hypothetical protein